MSAAYEADFAEAFADEAHSTASQATALGDSPDATAALLAASEAWAAAARAAAEATVAWSTSQARHLARMRWAMTAGGEAALHLLCGGSGDLTSTKGINPVWIKMVR